MNTERMVRVSSKGQIVLPKRLRDKMGLSAGDYLMLTEQAGGSMKVEKFSSAMLDEFLQPLTQAAKEQGFTREEIMKAIKAIRKERRANAA